MKGKNSAMLNFEKNHEIFQKKVVKKGSFLQLINEQSFPPKANNDKELDLRERKLSFIILLKIALF